MYIYYAYMYARIISLWCCLLCNKMNVNRSMLCMATIFWSSSIFLTALCIACIFWTPYIIYSNCLHVFLLLYTHTCHIFQHSHTHNNFLYEISFIFRFVFYSHVPLYIYFGLFYWLRFKFSEIVMVAHISLERVWFSPSTDRNTIRQHYNSNIIKYETENGYEYEEKTRSTRKKVHSTELQWEKKEISIIALVQCKSKSIRKRRRQKYTFFLYIFFCTLNIGRICLKYCYKISLAFSCKSRIPQIHTKRRRINDIEKFKFCITIFRLNS